MLVKSRNYIQSVMSGHVTFAYHFSLLQYSIGLLSENIQSDFSLDVADFSSLGSHVIINLSRDTELELLRINVS